MTGAALRAMALGHEAHLASVLPLTTHGRLLLAPVAAGHGGRQRAARLAAVALDVAMIRRSRQAGAPRAGGPQADARRPGVGRAAAVAGVLALDTTRCDDTNRAIYVAAAVPLAGVAGLELGFAPRSGRRPVALRLVGAAAAPLATVEAVKRRQGQPSDWGLGGWGILAGGLGVLLGWQLDQARVRATERWAEVAGRSVDAVRAAVRARMATQASVGHDFKKTLAILGALGSPEAQRAALVLAARPAAVLGATDRGGSTLYDAARAADVWPEPPDLWERWLTEAQCRQLADLVATTDRDLAGPAEDRVLEVLGADGGAVTVAYRGRRATLATPRPSLEGRLDPALTIAVGAAVWKLLRLRTEPRPRAGGGNRVAAMAAAAAVDLAAAATLAALGPTPAAVRAALAATTVSGVVFDIAAPATAGGAGRDADGPGTSGLQASAVALGTYWSSVGRWRWPALGGLGALWIATSRPTAGWRPVSVAREALWVAELVAAPLDFHRRLADARRSLDATLDEALEGRLAGAEAEEVAAELERLGGELALADRALAELAGGMDPELASAVRADCEEMRAWLGDPATPGELRS